MTNLSAKYRLNFFSLALCSIYHFASPKNCSMKPFLLLLAVFTFINAQAQNNAIKFQVGYGIPLVNSALSVDMGLQANKVNSSVVKGSYGSGLQLEVGYVRSLSKMVSLQFDAAYLLGKEIDLNTKDPKALYGGSISSYSRFLQVSPQLRATFGANKIRPYASVGPVVGIGSIYKKSLLTPDGPSVDSEEVFTGSIAIGAKTSLGMEMEQGKFIFYAQLSMVNMNYAPTKSEFTKYVKGGSDVLGKLTISEKQTDYKDSFTQGTQDPNQPTTDLTQYYPLNSLSLSMGVMYKF
jgi:hypothetical protein